jgi:hypothetical protein
VHWAPGIPHALSWAEGFCKTRAHRAAGMRTCIWKDVYLEVRHCEERLVRRSSTSEGGSDEAIQLSFRGEMDCFAEPVIGRRFAPTRWLAMTVDGPGLPKLGQYP